jgi:hypothetical protein
VLLSEGCVHGRHFAAKYMNANCSDPQSMVAVARVRAIASGFSALASTVSCWWVRAKQSKLARIAEQKQRKRIGANFLALQEVN